MSEYSEVEQLFLQQLAALGWTVIDQGTGIPQDAGPSLRGNFRQWLLPEVFDTAVRAINRTNDGSAWLTDRQLEDLRGQLLRQPNRTRCWRPTRRSRPCCSRRRWMSTSSPANPTRWCG